MVNFFLFDVKYSLILLLAFITLISIVFLFAGCTTFNNQSVFFFQVIHLNASVGRMSCASSVSFCVSPYYSDVSRVRSCECGRIHEVVIPYPSVHLWSCRRTKWWRSTSSASCPVHSPLFSWWIVDFFTPIKVGSHNLNISSFIWKTKTEFEYSKKQIHLFEDFSYNNGRTWLGEWNRRR